MTQVARVNAQGAADQSGPVAAFTTAPDLLKAAFMAPQGEPTDFAPTPDGGYALVRVDAIIPAGARPFEQLKPMLPAAWKASKIGDGMRVIAEAVIKAVASGKSFADATAAQNIKIAATSQAIDRNSLRDPAIAQLAGIAFAASEGDVVMAPDGHGVELLLAHVEKVLREAPARNPQLFAQARQAADKMASDDFLVAMQTQALAAAAPKTNDKLVDQTLGIGKEADPQNP